MLALITVIELAYDLAIGILGLIALTCLLLIVGLIYQHIRARINRRRHNLIMSHFGLKDVNRLK